MKLIIMLSVIVSLATACNDVEFEQPVQANVDDLSTKKDPNFDENGEYIDNVVSGLKIINIQSDIINTDLIGNQGTQVTGNQTCLTNDGISGCYNNNNSEIFVADSFERTNVALEDDSIFGWRTIIDDNGKLINGNSSDNVEFKTYDNSILGEASNGDKSLYFTGRAGAGSVHNLYLVTKSFDLSDTNGIVYFSFDYLPIGLDAGEFLKLEVCNDTLDKCGAGKNISVAGLNGSHWKTIFASNGQEARANLNGFNHVRADWINKQIAIRLDGFQRDNFVFRINAYMNEGFYSNNPNQGVDDAIGVDNFKAFTFLTTK